MIIDLTVALLFYSIEVTVDEKSAALAEVCRRALTIKSNETGFFTTTVGHIQLHFQAAAGHSSPSLSMCTCTVPVNMTKSACFMLDKYQLDGLPTPVSQCKTHAAPAGIAAYGADSTPPSKQRQQQQQQHLSYDPLVVQSFTPFAQQQQVQVHAQRDNRSHVGRSWMMENSHVSAMEMSHDQTLTSQASAQPWTANISHHTMPAPAAASVAADCNASFPLMTSQQLIECKKGVFFRRECINFGAVAIGSLTRTKIELCNSTDEEVGAVLCFRCILLL